MDQKSASPFSTSLRRTLFQQVKNPFTMVVSLTMTHSPWQYRSFALLLLMPFLQAWRSTTALGSSDSTLHWVPDYSEYYYTSLKEKMDEVMSLNNCTLTTHGDEITGYEVPDGSSIEPDLSVRIMPPPRSVRKRWGSENHELFNISTIYMRTARDLCTAKKFIAFKKGMYKVPKGCANIWKEGGKNGGSTKAKQVIRYGATIHPHHVRCDNKAATSVCVAAGEQKMPLAKQFRQLHQYPFMVTAKNVLVSRSGVLLPPCGPVALLASCEAVMWSLKRAREVANYSQICRNAYTRDADMDASTCPFPVHNRVFVIAQYDDGQIGQFMQESLPKLVYHYEFLKANPDIKIQFGFSKKDELVSFVLPHYYFKWLGMYDRLINGTVYAREAYLPREGGCQDPGYNAWEVVTMREKLLELAGIHEDHYNDKEAQPRTIVIISRIGSGFTNNKSDYIRYWYRKVLMELLVGLKRLFPTHPVNIFSDADRKLMESYPQQIKMFYDADIVIAFHGAGMMNTIFMKPGGVVMEVLPYFDAR